MEDVDPIVHVRLEVRRQAGQVAVEVVVEEDHALMIGDRGPDRRKRVGDRRHRIPRRQPMVQTNFLDDAIVDVDRDPDPGQVVPHRRHEPFGQVPGNHRSADDAVGLDVGHRRTVAAHRIVDRAHDGEGLGDGLARPPGRNGGDDTRRTKAGECGSHLG